MRVQIYRYESKELTILFNVHYFVSMETYITFITFPIIYSNEQKYVSVECEKLHG